jgi:peptidoglycan/xylan/chitin deacetylase (PgdA/CDA1 family)
MRERVAEWLYRTGALRAVMELRRHAPVPQLSIITYHHIADHHSAYPYDPEVADAAPAQFRRQMETLVRYGTPVGVDDLIGALDGTPLPKNPVMVTFDDGYRSCHDVALPILRSVGIRATFFIATSFVSERRLYWWERISLMIGQARRNPRRTAIVLSYPHKLVLELDHRQLFDKLTDLIKDTYGLDLERFLRELAVALDVEWTSQLEARYADDLIMTWDQIRALARAGMDVESHSRHHRVLQTLDAATLADDLRGSREDLETQLGRPVRVLAYPVGRGVNGERHIRDALSAAGYRIGMSNKTGVNRWWPPALRGIVPIDPFDVRRLATDRSISDAMFLTQVAVPRLAYVSPPVR